MTIVAGFRCSTGGVLLCADREENDGYNKREVEKIYRIPVTDLQVCDVFLAGAGNGDLIRKFQPLIHECLFHSHQGGTNLVTEHVRLFESELKKFKKQQADSIKKDGDFRFIVVMAPFNSTPPQMYCTKNEAMIPEQIYCALGTGQPIADYFTDRLFQWERMDKRALAALAAFILREAQDSATGVGLGNDMVFIHEVPRTLHFIPKDHVKKLQDGIPTLTESLHQYWEQHATIPGWIDNPQPPI
jgi:20S proteasome alpha/beta subunit